MAESILKKLVYIYTGTSNYHVDFDLYHSIPGARLVWEFADSGALVAAFDLGAEPYLLLANHAGAPGNRLIYAVEDLEEAAKDLRENGWNMDDEPFEVPDGPCIKFSDKSGNQYAILQMTRPYVLEKEYVHHS